MGHLGDILRTHGNEYIRRFGDRMSLDQVRAVRAVQKCHTPAAGSALWRCKGCGHRHFTYRGCGNRHCPSCGTTAASEWLRKQCALLLPGVTYHLITFTVPSGLRRPVRSHPRELLDLLMREASSTLLNLCDNPKWIGGKPGVTAVLHTWKRQGEYHPHVHFIATGGGLDSSGIWRSSHPKFLVPVHAMSRVFRARFRDALREKHPEIFAQIKPSVWKWSKKWVAHSKPVSDGENAYRSHITVFNPSSATLQSRLVIPLTTPSDFPFYSQDLPYVRMVSPPNLTSNQLSCSFFSKSIRLLSDAIPSGAQWKTHKARYPTEA